MALRDGRATVRNAAVELMTNTRTTLEPQQTGKSFFGKVSVETHQRIGFVQAESHRLMSEVGKVIVGKNNVLELVMINILAQGNLLFEDVPGLAKTVMVSTFARASGCDFKRIQFTPDVLPADITGSSVYDQRASTFSFRPGPVFSNFLLADEINRASPKTQSALLEAMQEHQVSVEGKTHRLEAPFIVMATQNPIEQEGTYPLPEAQMDRFLMRLSVGYPAEAEEVEIARRRLRRGKDEFDVTPVTSSGNIVSMQKAVELTTVDDAVLQYVARLVHASRKHPEVLVGSSPRGTLGLVKAARALAALSGRPFVTPDDVRRLAGPVLAHRIILKPEARFAGRVGGHVVEDLLKTTKAPTV